MNSIILHGRLVRDPQVGETSQGVKYANFTVACDRPFTDGGQKQTDFIDCTAWRQSAEVLANHFKKGKGIVLQGSLRIRNYTDQAGQKRTSAEVHADRVEFTLGDPRESGDTAASNAVSTDPPAFVGAGDGVENEADPWAEC